MGRQHRRARRRFLACCCVGNQCRVADLLAAFGHARQLAVPGAPRHLFVHGRRRLYGVSGTLESRDQSAHAWRRRSAALSAPFESVGYRAVLRAHGDLSLLDVFAGGAMGGVWGRASASSPRLPGGAGFHLGERRIAENLASMGRRAVFHRIVRRVHPHSNLAVDILGGPVAFHDACGGTQIESNRVARRCDASRGSGRETVPGGSIAHRLDRADRVVCRSGSPHVDRRLFVAIAAGGGAGALRRALGRAALGRAALGVAAFLIHPTLMAAAELSPSDFASGMPVVTSAEAAAYRVALPLAVYQGSAHESLADIRVFNAGGEVVPYAISRPSARTLPHGPGTVLPSFALRGDSPAAADAGR